MKLSRRSAVAAGLSAHGAGIPPGSVTIAAGVVPTGPGASKSRSYVLVETLSNLETAVKPIRTWVARVKLPKGCSVGWGPAHEYRPAAGMDEQIGWRSYLLSGPAVVDGTQVVRVEVVEDELDSHQLEVTLNTVAARRFEAFTRAHTKKRAALVVCGAVESAPVIMNAIPGGKVRLSPGADGVDRLFREISKR